MKRPTLEDARKYLREKGLAKEAEHARAYLRSQGPRTVFCYTDCFGSNVTLWHDLTTDRWDEVLSP